MLAAVAVDVSSTPVPPAPDAESLAVRGETCLITMQKREADQKVGIDLGYSQDGRWLVVAQVQPGVSHAWSHVVATPGYLARRTKALHPSRTSHTYTQHQHNTATP